MAVSMFVSQDASALVVIINEEPSKSSYIQSGVRQGYPLEFGMALPFCYCWGDTQPTTQARNYTIYNI